MPLPPNASITDVINKLTELEGINQKTELASVIGSPALSTDTVAQQIVKLQDSKDLLASNLTSKGQSSIGSEALNELVTKVGNISTGASGTITSSSSFFTFTYFDNSGTQSLPGVVVSGLNFKPSYIIIEASNQNQTTVYKVGKNSKEDSVVATSNSGSTSTFGIFKAQTSPSYVNETGFRLPFYTTNLACNWYAFK